MMFKIDKKIKLKTNTTKTNPAALPHLLFFISLLSFVFLSHAFPVHASSAPVSENIILNRGIGIGIRFASSPFIGNDAEDDSTLYDILPLFYYEDDHFYIDGLEGGAKLLTADDWQLHLLARWRFFDVPDDVYDNLIDTDVIDWGLAARYQPEQFYLEMELLADGRQRLSSNWRAGAELQSGSVSWEPYAGVRFKEARYNKYYYGLTVDDLGGGMDVVAGLEARYPLFAELFLLGSVEATWLGNAARSSCFVKDDFQSNVFLGISYENRKPTPASSIEAKPYLRLAHGWATESNIGEIVSLERKRDLDNNQLTSIFYGYPIADELLGLDIQSYISPGAIYHWASGIQESSQEFVLALKSYYTFSWPFNWRFGVAEGLSFVDRISYIEQAEMDEKGLEASRWLLYLDFSLDIELGNFFKADLFDDLWLGYSLHHRSGIFGKSSMFGDISGGSNYNSVYLQYHF